MSKPIRAFYWKGTDANTLAGFKNVKQSLIALNLKEIVLRIENTKNNICTELLVPFDSYVIQFNDDSIMVYEGEDEEGKMLWEKVHCDESSEEIEKDDLPNRVKKAYFEMVHYSGFPEKDVINIIKGQLMMDGVDNETIEELTGGLK